MKPFDWLGLALTVVSIILAVYFYLRSRQKKELSCVSFAETILGGGNDIFPQDVTILYKDERIPNLVKSNWTIWNSGNQPIRHEDIVPSSPILLKLAPDSKLLNAAIVKMSLPQNGVTIRSSAGSVQEIVIDFVYLEPTQGFKIELLHNASPSAALTGTIVGMPQGIKIFEPGATIVRGGIYWGVGLLAIGAMMNVLLVFLSFFYLPALMNIYVSSYHLVYIVSVLLVNLLILLPLSVVGWRRRWSIVRDPIPKELGRLRDVFLPEAH